MQYSITWKSKIENDLNRLDSEYHVGIKKLNISALSGFKLLNLCKKLAQGPNPIFSNEGIPCLNGKNIYFGTSEAGEPNYVSEKEFDNLKTYHLKENDILITLKHATRIGRPWIFKSKRKATFSRNLGLIRLKEGDQINAETLLFYLWGDGPQELLNLIATGGSSGQITLSMAELKKFPVPSFSEKFQDCIRNVFSTAEKFVTQSKILFEKAQSLLLSELGLLDWKPMHRLSFVKNFSDTKEPNGSMQNTSSQNMMRL